MQRCSRRSASCCPDSEPQALKESASAAEREAASLPGGAAGTPGSQTDEPRVNIGQGCSCRRSSGSPGGMRLHTHTYTHTLCHVTRVHTPVQAVQQPSGAAGPLRFSPQHRPSERASERGAGFTPPRSRAQTARRDGSTDE